MIGNERELQLKLTRAVEETEKLQANARQALLLAEQARDAGDQAKAASYEDSARAFATKLVSAEAAMKDLHAMSERAAQASPRRGPRSRPTPSLAEEDRRADQAAVPARSGQDAGAAQPGDGRHDRAGRPGDTPSLDEVRDKIEGRYARALGEAELQSTSIEARMLQVERASIDAEGAARLESIRKGSTKPVRHPEVEPSKKAPSDGS